VKINAGGTLFTTSITTLTKYDGLLKKMLSGDYEVEKMKDGSIFLDIAPEIFSYIIAFIRNPVFYPPEDAKDRESLRMVAESYGMKELCDYLNKYKKKPNTSTEHIYENVPILIQPNSNREAYYNIPIINVDDQQQQQQQNDISY